MNQFQATQTIDSARLLEGLNPPQAEAVTQTEGATLVLAGAGSGKTRVLVHRIAWLMETQGVSPYGILAVTFTNKAAGEMRGRIASLLDVDVRGLWVGTFHGIAHRLLRQHWQEANLPQDFQIIDSDDQKRIIKRLLKDQQIDATSLTPASLQGYINARKDEGLRPANIDPGSDPVAARLRELYDAYEAICRRGGLVDFAELLLRSNELWLQQPQVLMHYRERFRHLLVDEFQDTNTLQYAWLRNLAGDRATLFVVGDDDQAIYGWRGARVENILRFDKDFSPVTTVRLEQNYRSTNTILSAANALISHNAERLGKNLWSDQGDGDPIALYAAYNEVEEARYVVEAIERWMAAGNRRDQAAILYRSNAQSRAFEEALMQRRIPYRVYGGTRFFERAEIKDALAYLRLTANPADDASFERVVNLPTRGIGARTVENLRAHARARQLSLHEAALDQLTSGELSGRAANAVRSFLELLDTMRRQTADHLLPDRIERTIQLSGLIDHYAKEPHEKGQARIENLQELITAGSYFTPEEEVEGSLGELNAFLAHAALEAGEEQGDAWDDCVQLMTLHSAKGLEFDLVFLCGLEEGLFPHQRSVEEPGRLQEERRLAYVGMTRARQFLYLCYAESRRLHGDVIYGTPSRFVAEVPAEHIQEVRPRTGNGLETTRRPSGSRPTGGRSDNRTAKPRSSVPQQVEGGLFVGQRVQHEKFGEGVVLGVEGDGARQRIQVNFASAGAKWLMAAYANLRPI